MIDTALDRLEKTGTTITTQFKFSNSFTDLRSDVVSSDRIEITVRENYLIGVKLRLEYKATMSNETKWMINEIIINKINELIKENKNG